MKESIYSLDIAAVVSELQEYVDTKVQKIYHERPEILFYLYSAKSKDKILRIIPSQSIHITNYKREHRKYPTNFCMFLRKYLTNSIVTGISQPKMERIVRIDFKRGDEKFNMIIELFSKGNVILCKEDLIIQPLTVQRWKDRTIKAKEKYLFPPSKFDISSSDMTEFSKTILKSEKSDLVRAIAIDIGIGGPYAEELCVLSEIPKKKLPTGLDNDELNKLWKTLRSMIKNTKSPEGLVWEDDVTPFSMRSYPDKKPKRFPSFNEALDSYFTENFIKKGKHIEEELKEEEVQKLRKRIEDQRSIVEEYEQRSRESRENADIIANNLETIKNIVRLLMNAREQHPWNKIIEIIESEKEKGVHEASIIKEIIPDEGKVILELEKDIEIDITSNPADIMDDYYELAKKSESKIIGAREAIQKTEEDIKKAKEKEVKIEAPELIEKKKRKNWYDTFLWFKSSEGHLVISGKDATQNEILMKKHLEVDDLVFHADIQGSPFTLVKNGRSAGEKTLNEAAIQTATYSKAWASNMAVDVYYVQSYQVSKTAPSGEYIKKGSFMIRGKKTFIKNIKSELAIGISKDHDILAGPRRAIMKSTLYYVILTPGDMPTGNVAKEIREVILKKVPSAEKIQLEEIQKFVPGKSMLIRR